MSLFDHIPASTFTWHHRSIWTRNYDLRDGENIVASFRMPHYFKVDAIGEGFGGSWEFIPKGIFGKTIEVREKGFELPFARWEKKAFKSDSEIFLPKGERLIVEFSMWKGSTRVLTQDRREIFVRTSKLSFHTLSTVVPGIAWKELERFPWVLVLIEHDAAVRRHQSAAAHSFV